MDVYKKQAEICAALANPVRMQVLELLENGESTATDLQKVMHLSKANLSQHLSILKRNGMIHVRSKGLYRYLSLAPQVRQARRIIRQILERQLVGHVDMAKNLGGKHG